MCTDHGTCVPGFGKHRVRTTVSRCLPELDTMIISSIYRGEVQLQWVEHVSSVTHLGRPWTRIQTQTRPAPKFVPVQACFTVPTSRHNYKVSREEDGRQGGWEVAECACPNSLGKVKQGSTNFPNSRKQSHNSSLSKLSQVWESLPTQIMIHSVTQVLLTRIANQSSLHNTVEFQTMSVLDNHKHSDKLNENEHTLDGTYGFERTLMWPLSKLTPNVPFQGTPTILKCYRVLTLNFSKWWDCHDFSTSPEMLVWDTCFHVFMAHGRKFIWDGFPRMG